MNDLVSSIEHPEEKEEETPPTSSIQSFTPYKDDPEETLPTTPGPDPPYSDGEVYQMQQQMMDGTST